MAKSQLSLAPTNHGSNTAENTQSAPVYKDLIFSKDDIKQMLADVKQADRIFDKALPPEYQTISRRQWTPAAVARQVAKWLGPKSTGKKIVDIGSGVGKFCVLLALQSEIEICGIEQRKSLYEISVGLANANLLKGITFINGNMIDLPWKDFDIFYLYNPFQEHLVDNGWSRINDEIDFHPALYADYSHEVFSQLVEAKKGKILITFHGYGGVVPGTWRIVQTVKINGGDLCMWEKMI